MVSNFVTLPGMNNPHDAFVSVPNPKELEQLSKERVGMCPKCFEWAAVGESCCGRGVWLEGSLIRDEAVNQ